MAFNWECPYCNSKTTITKTYEESFAEMHQDSRDGQMLLHTLFIICPNVLCQKVVLSAELNEHIWSGYDWKTGKLLESWQLIPNTNAKIFPSYIPAPLIKDYQEAYSILTLSPKASATLSRRCLQGMIRDFWNVSKPTLYAEINAVQDKVDPLIFKSIDAVRKVGNIGAHMEKDINLIIDVEPKEATMLIQLIELLFEEWYIHRHEREKKLNAIVGIAEMKDEAKKIIK